MKKYAASVVYLSGNVVLAKVFVCDAEQIKDAQKQLADFIEELGIPENLVIDKRLNTIESPNKMAFIGAFAIFTKPGGFKADFVILYARDEEQFADLVASSYTRGITPTTVLVESMDIRLLSEF